MYSKDTCTWVLITLAFVLIASICAAEVPLEYDPETNLALGATAEASSSATKPGAKYWSDKLTDGDFDNAWATERKAELPQWVKLTFEEPVKLDTVVLVPRTISSYGLWADIRIEFSSGDPVETTLENREGLHLIRFAPRTTESLKVTLLSDHRTSSYYGLHELLAFHDPDRAVKEKVPLKRRWKNVELEEAGREEHPCVYITAEDVQTARENIDTHEWAREYADRIIALADTVVDKEAEWIRENCPQKGAAFAYGRTGCPICGAKWGTWGGANCSFDRPGTVKCRNGHILPDEDHPDPGTGYEAEDGRIHYFVGSYNAWVVETYQKWCDWLSFAYTITGEEKYAQTCAVILDAIAEIYPYCDKGSWDYPSNPPSGRLCRPWYQVARVLVTLVDYYDKIYNSPALDEPSFVEGMSRHENIEENMLKNGAWYCYEQSLKGGMHNGEADYIRGALSVGCLLGIERYVDWAVHGPYGINAMIHNNADRDGRYIESSLSYALHCRDLYLTFAEPLINYRSEQYPNGLNLYDDSAFRSFYVLPRLEMSCVGHWPRYGDAGPDTSKRLPPDRPFDARDARYAERIYLRTADPVVKEAFAALVRFFADGGVENLRAASTDREWLLFHADESPQQSRPLADYIRRRIEDSVLMGQKGIGILRTLPGTQAQACLMRYGPVLNHGHFDDLNINYFGVGYELTYDLGYGGGSTHTQVGWGKQTASHQLVVVNETRQQSDYDTDDSGGSLHMLADMPGLRVMDADADNVYRSQGVEEYRRCITLVGDGPGSYLVDIFNVEGGTQHDYVAHSLSTDVDFEGVSFGDRADGSLVGEEYNWGERQLNDGYLSGVPHKPYWNPPPENGYGFLMHPRRGTTSDPLSATWHLPDNQSHMRLTVLPEDEVEVINCRAPGIYPHNPEAEHLCIRRTGEDLHSTFVTIREPYAPESEGETGLDAADLIGLADTDDGIIKHLGNIGVVLFQAEAFGGEIDFELSAPEDGEYYVYVMPFRSPNYSAVQFILNGRELGEPFFAGAEGHSFGPPQTFGPIELDEGTHTLTVRTVDGDGGKPWISIRSAGLLKELPTEGGHADPVIASAERFDVPDGCAALEVTMADGAVDRFVYAATPGALEAGDLDLDGSFGHLRTDADQITAAHVVGTSLSAPGFEMSLAHGSHTGEIVEVDYENNRVIVDTELPTDGRLNFETIQFSNPRYTRNTAYTIYDVTREDGRTVIDFGPQKIVLGEGTVHGEPAGGTLLSLTPHDYARGLTRRGVDFFDGKLLVSEDGSTYTHVKSATYDQPFVVEVDSTEGFSEGDRFLYIDLQPGDEFVIHNWAAVSRDEAGRLKVMATDDVELTTGGRTRTIKYSDR